MKKFKILTCSAAINSATGFILVLLPKLQKIYITEKIKILTCSAAINSATGFIKVFK